MAALYERAETGKGRYVEVGIFDCVYPTLISQISKLVLSGDAPPRTGNQHSEIAPYNVYKAADGSVALICPGDRQWRKLVEVMDRPDLLADDRFATVARRAEHADAIDEAIQSWLADRPAADIVERLLDQDVPAATVNAVGNVVEHPQLDHRYMVNWLPNRGEGSSEVPVPGSPSAFRDEDGPAVRPAPPLGADTADVLQEVAGYSAEDIETLRSEDAI